MFFGLCGEKCGLFVVCHVSGLFAASMWAAFYWCQLLNEVISCHATDDQFYIPWISVWMQPPVRKGFVSSLPSACASKLFLLWICVALLLSPLVVAKLAGWCSLQGSIAQLCCSLPLFPLLCFLFPPLLWLNKLPVWHVPFSLAKSLGNQICSWTWVSHLANVMTPHC